MDKICLGKNFCMDKKLLLLIILVAVGILVYDHFALKKEIKEINNTQVSQQLNPTQSNPTQSNPTQLNPTQLNPTQSNPTQSNPTQQIPPTSLPAIPVGQIMKDYDYRTLEDPLTPPFKRDDYMIPAQMARPDLYGLYTSGAPGTFRKMGYLKSTNPNSEYKYLNLIGRPKYNGSSIYEYYVTSTNRDDSIKFYLNKYKRELYDNDKVKVPQIGSEEFEVIMDKDLNLEYNPLIF